MNRILAFKLFKSNYLNLNRHLKSSLTESRVRLSINRDCLAGAGTRLIC